MLIAPTRYEVFLYSIFLLLIAVAGIGVPVIGKAFYAFPLLVVLVWLVYGRLVLAPTRLVLPFLGLVCLGLVSMIPWDLNAFKKTFFLLVFASTFLLVDFSNARIDFRKLLMFFVFLGVARILLHGERPWNEAFSLADSRSVFENTFAFPIGVLAVYFLVERRFLWMFVALLFAVIFLKRIVLVAWLVVALIWILPRALRLLILNPFTVTVCTVAVTVLAVEFGFGVFNETILDLTERAANDLSKGRQHLWEVALEGVDYSHSDFILWGVGVGKVISELQDDFRVDRILLHNDLLSLALEIGWIGFALFVFSLNALATQAQRLVALFITILFATDNVIIYQHLMFVYLFVQQQLNQGEALRHWEARTRGLPLPGASTAPRSGV